MKILSLFFIILLTAVSSHADKKKSTPTLAKDECQKKLSSIVSQAGRAMGINGEFGIHWADPVKKATSSEGLPIYEYATGVFIYDGGTVDTEGFLPDSGAKASVIKSGKSCKVLKIEISIGS